MPSQKQYQMEFLMGARLNGNFGAAFTKAQQEFARLGREIQTVNRLQSDISAYQKQQQAVQNTEKKHANLTRQMQLLEAEMRNASANALPGLEREHLKLEQRLDNTSAALERQQQKVQQTGERL